MIIFSIVTPKGVVCEEEGEKISLPTSQGEITVLEHHIPLTALLQAGVITFWKGGEEIHFASSGGFVEVLPSEGDMTRVRVVSDTAEYAKDLTEEEVEAARARAEKMLQEKRLGEKEEYAVAAGTLERELARLKAIRRRKKRSV